MIDVEFSGSDRNAILTGDVVITVARTDKPWWRFGATRCRTWRFCGNTRFVNARTGKPPNLFMQLWLHEQAQLARADELIVLDLNQRLLVNP